MQTADNLKQKEDPNAKDAGGQELVNISKQFIKADTKQEKPKCNRKPILENTKKNQQQKNMKPDRHSNKEQGQSETIYTQAGDLGNRDSWQTQDQIGYSVIHKKQGTIQMKLETRQTRKSKLNQIKTQIKSTL